MDYAIIAVPAAPVRKKPGHREEMVNQLLFGEAVQVLKTKGDIWVKVRSLYDEYDGWVTNTMLAIVEEATAKTRSSFVAADLFTIAGLNGTTIPVSAGASLPSFDAGGGKLGALPFEFSGTVMKVDEQVPGSELAGMIAGKWLNAPYLWGGRTPLGVDCSGFMQVVFKLMGIGIRRDASQQAAEGKEVKKFKYAQPGDLAFFSNKKSIVHVGMLIAPGKIIHSSGKVRIDSIDKKGIINDVTGKRGYPLERIRRYW